MGRTKTTFEQDIIHTRPSYRERVKPLDVLSVLMSSVAGSSKITNKQEIIDPRPHN